MEKSNTTDHPDLDKVRIWQWEGNDRNGTLVDRVRKRAANSSVEQSPSSIVKYELERIRNERQDKARDLAWSGKATWIHIPVNDMNLCETVLRSVCRPGQANRLLRPDYWTEQAHEPSTQNEATDMRFMEAKGWALEFIISEEKWKPEGMVQKWDQDKVTTENDNKDTSNIVRNIVLYMPYLHWDRLSDHIERTKTETTSTIDARSRVHPRRSLDEASNRYHRREDMLKRNNDQVVTRFLKNKESQPEPTLMMVDQLWLWMLDPGESHYTQRLGVHNDDRREKRLCDYLHLECLAQGRFNIPNARHGAHRLAACIINRSYSIFQHPWLRISDLKFLEMFKISIETERAKCADLFFALQGLDIKHPQSSHGGNLGLLKPEQRSPVGWRRLRGILNIQEDMSAAAVTQDIQEELRIILHVVRQQRNALRSPVHPRSKVFEEDLEEFTREIEDISEQARNVHDMLFQILELKQTLLSIQQNRVVIIFTVITIIFLPLSFISSIFGMNATELSDGSSVPLSRIFAYMFPISFTVSIAALGWAFVLPIR
ncbi:hypothetical protein OPT61_g3611 [Boeremia exigua]|uniref:Uncharacterized protein n=1 Tax=Boeremia exigua TaxID=749465 RepID=A0ACC2IHB1_9PLEO|nr:hypothetical protein OPT61_g3611 [Boeremia exigua]